MCSEYFQLLGLHLQMWNGIRQNQWFSTLFRSVLIAKSIRFELIIFFLFQRKANVWQKTIASMDCWEHRCKELASTWALEITLANAHQVSNETQQITCTENALTLMNVHWELTIAMFPIVPLAPTRSAATLARATQTTKVMESLEIANVSRHQYFGLSTNLIFLNR